MDRQTFEEQKTHDQKLQQKLKDMQPSTQFHRQLVKSKFFSFSLPFYFVFYQTWIEKTLKA